MQKSTASSALTAVKNKDYVKQICLALILFYRKYISPLKPASCRFYPSCSKYAFDAVNKYGVLKGAFLSLQRITKCHPFNPGGYDPVN